ncbi:MAG: DUF1307 domain-containing protein [Thomasclavelia sp.]|jgi:uncharacterized lipoprotein YehR (DUF1307 family)|nr:DUF1307 domain-containing protein [Thomasclavelia sp.]
MKKIKSLLVMAVALLVLVGCGSSSVEKTTTTATLTTTSSGIPATEVMTIKAEDDKVMSQSNLLTYKLAGTSYETLADQTLEQIKSGLTAYASCKGVTIDSKVEGTNIIVTVTINYKKADLSELKTAGLVTSTTGEDVDYISLKETKKALKQQGYTIKTVTDK